MLPIGYFILRLHWLPLFILVCSPPLSSPHRALSLSNVLSSVMFPLHFVLFTLLVPCTYLLLCALGSRPYPPSQRWRTYSLCDLRDANSQPIKSFQVRQSSLPPVPTIWFRLRRTLSHELRMQLFWYESCRIGPAGTALQHKLRTRRRRTCVSVLLHSVCCSSL